MRREVGRCSVVHNRHRLSTFPLGAPMRQKFRAMTSPQATNPNEWSDPYLVSEPSEDAFVDSLAVNTRGDVLVGFSQGTALITRLRSANGRWQAPGLLPTFGHRHSELRIVLAHDGSADAVWNTWLPGPRDQRTHLAYAPAGGAWSVLDRRPGSTAWIDDACFAITERGERAFSWCEVTNRRRRYFSAQSNGDGQWTPSQLLTEDGVPTSLVICFDRSENLWALWQNSSPSALQEAIMAAFMPRGSSWRNQFELSSGRGKRSWLAVASPLCEDGIAAAWNRETGYRAHVVDYAEGRAGVWTPVRQLSPPGQTAAIASVAFDRSGSGVATWHLFDEMGQPHARIAMRDAEGIWSEPTPVASAGSTSDASTRVASTGEAFTAWINDTDGRPQLIACIQSADGSWSPPALLSRQLPDRATGVMHYCTAIGEGGLAAAAWTRRLATERYVVELCTAQIRTP